MKANPGAFAYSFRKAPRAPPVLTSLSEGRIATYVLTSYALRGIWDLTKLIFGTGTSDSSSAPSFLLVLGRNVLF